MPDASFEEDFQRSLQELRGVLVELFTALGVAIDRPLELTRQYGLKRNLGWKLSRLLQTEDPFAAQPYLPSASGLFQFLDQLGGRGVPEDRVLAVRRAMEDFEAVVERHVGDRPGLELVLEAAASTQDAARPPLASRKSAFRGNCGIWGIEARVRLGAYFLAPSEADPRMADVSILTGLVGLTRYRADAIWPLGRREVVDEERVQLDLPPELAIDPSYQDDPGPKLMSEFCSSPLPPIRCVRSLDGLRYELAEGRIGKQGVADLFLGSGYRAAVPLQAQEGCDWGQFECAIDAPVRTLQFDLFLHRELPLIGGPSWIAASRLYGDEPLGADPTQSHLLPLAEPSQMVGSGLRVVSSPLVPNYAAICSQVYRRMDWNPDEFQCHRLVMEYPPLAASVVARFTLPEA